MVTRGPLVFFFARGRRFCPRCLVDYISLRLNITIVGAELVEAIVNKIPTVIPYAIR